MEWAAKNQTLSHDLTENDAFRPFLPTEVKKAPEHTPLLEQASPQPGNFVPSPDLWNTILRDPWISREISTRIETGIREGVEEGIKKEFTARFEVERKTVSEEAYQKGYTEGLEKGTKEGWLKGETEFQPIKLGMENKLNDLTQHVQRLSDLLISEKKEILADHEARWCKALTEILGHFQVENALNLSSAIEQWMEERMGEFNLRSKVQVFLSPDEYSQLAQSSGDITRFPWEYAADQNLKVGEMRAECGDGGIFFSRSEWFQKLEEWLKPSTGKPEVKLEGPPPQEETP